MSAVRRYDFERWESIVLTELYLIAGRCGHCGKRNCAAKQSYSRLPDSIKFSDLRLALDRAREAKP